MKQKFQVTGMTCAACSAYVEKSVKGLDGVESVEVSLMTQSMQVSYDESVLTPEQIIHAVKAGGYGASVWGETSKPSPKQQAEENIKEMKVRLVASLLFLIPLFYIAMGHMMGLPIPSWLSGLENSIAFGFTQFLLTLPILYLNRTYYQVGIRTLLHGSPNMDSLIAVGSGAAVIYGVFAIYQMGYGLGHGNLELVAQYHMDLYFESAGMILTLITLGKFLETRSKGKTSAAITRLMDLSPKTATVVRNGQEAQIPVEQVQKGDLVRIRPGDAIPVDGVVIDGTSVIDESALTGESVPVEKMAGDTVSAATINQSGSFLMEATRVGEDTTLAQMIRLVEEAAASKAPIAKLADKVAGVFVPVVMSIALVTALLWFFLGGHDITKALTAGVAVLVISCPCALGLATPVAILVGTGKGAEHGILIKSAEALETLGKVNTVVLDKTGTLTEGKPVVTDILVDKDMDEEGLLILAACLEQPSQHPLAKTIVQLANEKQLPIAQVTQFEAVHGRGVKAYLGTKPFFGGNQAMMEELGVVCGHFTEQAQSLAREGKTPLFFADQEKVLGLIALADRPKPTSAQAVQAFHKLGLQVVMLTGDRQETAQTIGTELGVDQIVSQVLPHEKAQKVAELQQHGNRVAMIGDGINDAPALMGADVGLAIGAGTDIAIESADLVLMKSDLMDAVTAVELSRATIRNIKENLFWAFFYNALGIPLAAGLFYALNWTEFMLNPMFAAAAMSLSSVCVVSNALRLRWFHSKFSQAKPTQQNNPIKETKEGDDGIMEKKLNIEGMMCMHCVAHVEKALQAVTGVQAVKVDLEGKCATVQVDATVDTQALSDAVTQAGYQVVSVE